MKRIFLFIVTNIAVLVVISIIFSVFGIGDYLANQGTELDLGALQRLGGGAQRDLQDQLAAFGINGVRAGGFRRLFMSHPPISERIAALQNPR